MKATTNNSSKSTSGYKGHRAGTMAERAHKLVDQGVAKQVARAAILAQMKKIGVSESTAPHWYWVFTNAPKKPAAKKAAAPKKNGAAVVKGKAAKKAKAKK
jgi:hypothetical protein